MLEFPNKGNISWLFNKREFDVSYRLESEEPSRKRKGQESLADDEIVKRSETHNPTSSSYDQKRRRFSEDSTTTKKNIDKSMRLDLELNLSPSLIDLNYHHDHDLSNYNKICEEDERAKKIMMQKGSMLGQQTRKSMSWVAFDLDDDGSNGCRDGGGSGGGRDKEEMVAKVCMKCHMLVMLCKALPVCPNCKFIYSPEDTSLSLLFNPKPTLLA